MSSLSHSVSARSPHFHCVLMNESISLRITLHASAAFHVEVRRSVVRRGGETPPSGWAPEFPSTG